MEKLLAYYCAPAFAGIKPANIATFEKSRFPDLHRDISKLNKELNSKDIYIEILRECETRCLVIVYRKKVLEKHLNMQENANFLSHYGYCGKANISEWFSLLKSRLKCEEFPHEIGVFLGYPLNDVRCFIHHRDEGCLLVGEWKVYDNIKEAEKMFSRFKLCRIALTKQICDRGKTLAKIFNAA